MPQRCDGSFADCRGCRTIVDESIPLQDGVAQDANDGVVASAEERVAEEVHGPDHETTQELFWSLMDYPLAAEA